MGGVGLRRAGDLALPCYISSLFSFNNLIDEILANVGGIDGDEVDVAIAKWGEANGSAVEPSGLGVCSQKAWDRASCEQRVKTLLQGFNQVDRARFLAASQVESGQWLNAVPVPSLGTNLEPETLRVSLALRVGSVVCEPHKCRCNGGYTRSVFCGGDTRFLQSKG